MFLYFCMSVSFGDCILGVSHALLNAWLIRCPVFYLFHVCRDITKLVRVIRKDILDQYFSVLLWFSPHCCFALQSWRSLTKSTCTSWGYHRRTDVDSAFWTPLVQFQPVLVFLQGILVQEESKGQEIRGALTKEQLWAFTLIREHHFSTVID